MSFDEWWACLPDGWPVTKPWKNVAEAAWNAALESQTAECCASCDGSRCSEHCCDGFFEPKPGSKYQVQP